MNNLIIPQPAPLPNVRNHTPMSCEHEANLILASHRLSIQQAAIENEITYRRTGAQAPLYINGKWMLAEPTGWREVAHSTILA